MNLIHFTSRFKPEGKEYIRTTLWNHYISNKIMLLFLIAPPLLGVYFLVTGPATTLSLIFNIILILYPLFSFLSFYRKIMNHLKYRDETDTALTHYTFMDNGILLEQAEFDKLDMHYWHEYDCLYELKGYLILYYKDSLKLILDKKDMGEGQLDEIRSYILSHFAETKTKYIKAWFF